MGQHARRNAPTLYTHHKERELRETVERGWSDQKAHTRKSPRESLERCLEGMESLEGMHPVLAQEVLISLKRR